MDCKFHASFLQVSCKSHAVSCKFHASLMQGTCKFLTSFIQFSCRFHITRTCMHTHPFPILWKKVHMLIRRRDRSADLLCMVSPLLLQVTADRLDRGQIEASSQPFFPILLFGVLDSFPLCGILCWFPGVVSLMFSIVRFPISFLL